MDEDYTLGAFANYLSSVQDIELSLADVENIDLVLENSETDINIGYPSAGGGIFLKTSFGSGSLAMLDGSLFGNGTGMITLWNGLCIGTSVGYEPALRVKSTLLGDDELNLFLNDLSFSLFLGLPETGREWKISYFHHYRKNENILPDGDGVFLDLYWYTPLELVFSGNFEGNRGGVVWDFTYGQSLFYADGRVYRGGDYDSFITADEWEGIPSFNTRGEISYVSETGWSLGWFGEIISLSADRVVLNAPSSIVSNSYVYRFIMDDTTGRFWQTGLYGQETFSRKGKGEISFSGSCSYASLSGESDILEVYGVVIPFVSSAEQNDWGLVSYEGNFLIMDGGIEGKLYFKKGELLFSVNQMLPIVIAKDSGNSSGEGNGGGESGISSTSMIWGGFRGFLGVNLFL